MCNFIFINNSAKYLFFLLFASLFVKGQDIHFSQYDGSLLNNSPAFTGMFNGDYRVGAIFRSQWQSVPVPYSTFSMNGEARIKPKSFTNDVIGVGLMFNSDKAGDTRYKTTQLYASGSYIYSVADSSLLFSVGMNLGLAQVGFDYERMTFDNQYDGSQYNAGLNSNERFDWTTYNYADINVGGALQYKIKNKHVFTYGLGLHHLASPVITYQGNKTSRLDFKIANYLRFVTPINLRADIVAEALINKQGKYYEVIPHASLKYYINRDNNLAVLAGLAVRPRDAVILRFGYTNKTLQSGIAYDINTSKFMAATNRRGAFEIFVNYIIKRPPVFTVKKRVCPVYM
ncbi:MAG: PorP/SprF family type IX secretion system membrane protein [Bacteroidetes bacterium]|nr:PorP/SprF family type IX secretion system membrane protein [Bacteroidota bacterium]